MIGAIAQLIYLMLDILLQNNRELLWAQSDGYYRPTADLLRPTPNAWK